MKNILVTTDFSPLADLAFAPAGELARNLEGKLIAVHVIETPRPPKPDPTGPYFKAAQALYQADAEREAECLKELELRTRKLAGVDWKAVVGRGNPIKTVLEIARLEDSDLIVISSAGRSGIKRLLLGSVAEQMLRESPLPVLVWKQHPGA